MNAMPSHDIEAEKAVLGAMMLSADALAECLEALSGPGQEAFFRPAHQMVYEAIRTLADDGQPVDWLTVKAELERRNELARTGGPTCTHDLVTAVPAAVNGVHYARKLLDHHMDRALDLAGGRIRHIATAGSNLDRVAKADAAHEALDQATGLAVTSGAIPVPVLLGPFLEALEAGPDTTQGVLSGWKELDRLIPGFRPGEVVIVGGRPGMGKSVVMLNIATHLGVRQRVPVLVCSLEMSRDECMERIVSSVTGVELGRIRDRVLSEYDWDLVAKMHSQLNDSETFVINDSPDMTVQGIRAELRAMRRAGRPAQLVAVDYLQLMTGSGRPESRQLEVSSISRSFKKLAKEFAVPVLIGSQLNRGPEMRSDHRPLLADLRESGSLEQDSDIVILLYRDDAYVEESPHSGEIDLIVAKNRQGRKGTARLAWRGHYAMCADLYREDYTA